MRYGFFHGTEGDAALRETALQLLADCDRIVCLGDLFAERGPVHPGCIEAFGRLECLQGPGEKRRSRDPSLPPSLRDALGRLPIATVIDGIALIGRGMRRQQTRHEARALGGAPRLVAPLTVAAGEGATRLWRASGGLCRVEELAGPVRIRLGAERLRVDLAPSHPGAGLVQVVAIDREAKILQVRERRLGGLLERRPRDRAAVRRRRSSRRRVDAGQQLLAV